MLEKPAGRFDEEEGTDHEETAGNDLHCERNEPLAYGIGGMKVLAVKHQYVEVRLSDSR